MSLTFVLPNGGWANTNQSSLKPFRVVKFPKSVCWLFSDFQKSGKVFCLFIIPETLSYSRLGCSFVLGNLNPSFICLIISLDSHKGLGQYFKDWKWFFWNGCINSLLRNSVQNYQHGGKWVRTGTDSLANIFKAHEIPNVLLHQKIVCKIHFAKVGTFPFVCTGGWSWL